MLALVPLVKGLLRVVRAPIRTEIDEDVIKSQASLCSQTGTCASANPGL